MSTTTCHLSSLEICNGDQVVIIPVKYSYISETNQLIYGTNSSCTIACLPLFGEYSNYGSIVLDEDSEDNCSIFRTKINESLMNNPEIKFKKDNSKFYFGDSHYIFKRDDYDEAEMLCYSSDLKIIENSKKTEKFLNINEIYSNQEFLSYLLKGALSEASSSNVSRFGYLLIRRDIYDSMIDKSYSDDKERVLSKIINLFKIELKDSKDIIFNISDSTINKDTLELFNAENYLTHLVIDPIRIFIKCKIDVPESFINGLLHWSLVSKLYADIGKSFYPNVRRHGSMKQVFELNNIVNEHITNRKLENLKSYRLNGNNDDIPENIEWDDWTEIY